MLGNAYASPRYSHLTALKPRQVLLLEQQQRAPSVPASMAKVKNVSPSELNTEGESTLTCSIALWLETKGFSKVLKRFLSAAQIEDDSWRGRGLNLNEIFSKYLEGRNGVQEDLKSQNEPVGKTVANGDAICVVSDEIEGKRKKKQSKKKASTADDTTTPEVTTDNEKSKASKESNADIDFNTTVDQSAHKQKVKKKKNKLTSPSLDSDEKKTVEPAEDEANTTKKASKKRKRIADEENEDQTPQEVVAEKSKSKKTKKGLKEGKNAPSEITLPEANGTVEPNEGEIAQTGKVGTENGSAKQMDESTKVTLENNGVDKSNSKSATKNNKNSDEPKTVNVFQRVKIEDVKFADDRLQDNSYWAKDGADIGYGAKAQEVLGQVKGRDFRHEKTKKKRGSYRGGQIDLHSHSVKFNYSDEE